uniref:Aspartate--tRNA ligase 2, cytoplasmic n=1 Tax=Tanacetum cinerariifolium TaxID=118510 RepID=A0A699GZN5_TANCI|nr:aspartate--tRNA ligase 2, cytoplasmic [Tanacetum cinerariifolium]
MRKRLPISFEDASRSEAEIENLEAAGKQVVCVNQHTRLNNRVLDAGTPPHQAIFSLENKVLNLFGQLLRSEDFWQIMTPNIIAGSSEGGADVFKFEYKIVAVFSAITSASQATGNLWCTVAQRKVGFKVRLTKPISTHNKHT